MPTLSDEEVCRIAFQVGAKHLSGIELPDDFPLKITKEPHGVTKASWPDGFLEQVARLRAGPLWFWA
jgi:hypothetical protein